MEKSEGPLTRTTQKRSARIKRTRNFKQRKLLSFLGRTEQNHSHFLAAPVPWEISSLLCWPGLSSPAHPELCRGAQDCLRGQLATLTTVTWAPHTAPRSTLPPSSAPGGRRRQLLALGQAGQLTQRHQRPPPTSSMGPSQKQNNACLFIWTL